MVKNEAERQNEGQGKLCEPRKGKSDFSGFKFKILIYALSTTLSEMTQYFIAKYLLNDYV